MLPSYSWESLIQEFIKKWKAMKKESTLDRFHKVLFSVGNEKLFTEDEQKMLIRYRAVFTLSLETPWITNTEKRDFLMNEFHISIAQAYKDLSKVRVLLVNMQNAGKGWIRYIVNESLKKSIKDAQKMGKSGIKLGIMAAGKLAKFNMLDKEDSIYLSWEEIKPPTIEPTTDPTVLGIKPLQNKSEVIRKLYEKYLVEIEDNEYESLQK